MGVGPNTKLFAIFMVGPALLEILLSGISPKLAVKVSFLIGGSCSVKLVLSLQLRQLTFLFFNFGLTFRLKSA